MTEITCMIRMTRMIVNEMTWMAGMTRMNGMTGMTSLIRMNRMTIREMTWMAGMTGMIWMTAMTRRIKIIEMTRRTGLNRMTGVSGRWRVGCGLTQMAGMAKVTGMIRTT